MQSEAVAPVAITLCSAPVPTLDTAFLWTDDSHNTFFSKICFAEKQSLDSLNTFNAGVAG